MASAPVVRKVVFVGAGHMAQQHAQGFAGIPGVELAGVCGRGRERVEKFAAAYPALGIFSSIGEMYDKSRADIVVVAVSELSTGAVARECFKYPWIVLLEKPAGYDVADAREILQAATATSSRVYVALNRRCYSSTRAVAERLSRVDAPRFIKVQDQEDNIEARDTGRPDKIVDNWMYANAIHVIDYFRIFGRGKITKVTPVVAWKPDAPGVVVAHIEFNSGDVGLYEAIWNAPGPWAVSVNAGAERYELRPLETAGVQLHGERRLTAIPTESIDADYKPGLRFQAEQVLRAAAGDSCSLATLEDAYESMRLVARIYGHAC